MDADSRKIPSHEVTYARLRDMILFGHLAPGAPVTIQGLIAELDAGMTPVREAVQRRQLLMETMPGTPAAMALVAVASRIIG